MKLIEKIKSVPKKKFIILAVLIVMILTTLIIAFAIANRSDDTESSDSGGGSGADSVSVFKSNSDTGTPKSTETVEPLDLSGTNGLSYVSNGDGTCSIKGIGTCEDTELIIPSYSPSGDTVTKISDSAFENCTGLLSVTIPATVKSIGTGAFRGCSSLVSITVDTENTVYCSVNGVLFSEDKTVLVCYPIDRPNSSYLLSTDVKAIAAYAFEGALNLTGLLYEGSISDFLKIEILTGNDILDELAITCNYTSAK